MTSLDVFHALVKVDTESVMQEDRYSSLPLLTVLMGMHNVSRKDLPPYHATRVLPTFEV